jgi:hypothetical protein
MAYKSMLTQSNIQSYIQRLKKEEQGQDFLDSLINDFLTLSKKINIKISDGIKHEEIKDNGTVETYIQYKVTVSRKYRKKVIKTSLEYTNPLILWNLVVNFQQPDLSDVLLDVRLNIVSAPNSFEEYCERSGKSQKDPASKKEYTKEVKTANGLKQIFSEKEMTCLPTSSTMNDALFEGNIEAVIDVHDYNKLRDLQDHVQYYDKLMSQYGYDWKTGQWDTKRFPVTQTDRQIEGIESDIIKSREAVKEYNAYVKDLVRKYVKDLVRKYDVSIDKEDCKSIADKKEKSKSTDKKDLDPTTI